MALVGALALLAPSAAAAVGGELEGSSSGTLGGRTVEIRVTGDPAALARVRITARELLGRLAVQPIVKSSDEAPTDASEPPPLVVAYVDLRDVMRPSIDIQDGRSRQELTRRTLTDVTSLETGVEAALHVLYLTVESSLQVGTAPPPARAAAPVKPAPPAPHSKPERARSGLDVGALLRLSSLGGTRFVPGGGVVVEPHTDLGGAQLGLQLSAAVHGATELTFARGSSAVRPIQARVIPALDWLLSSDVNGSVGLGGGIDAFSVEPGLAPVQGRLVEGQMVVDPVLSAVAGARVPLAGRAFLSALASLDFDLQPTSFVARVGTASESVLQVPRWRGGLSLSLSFSVAGARRFPVAPERQ